MGLKISRWERIWVEEDSKLIINVMNGGKSHHWRLSIILKEVHQVANLFFEIIFSHICRSSNIVVDWAANQGVGLCDKEGVVGVK